MANKLSDARRSLIRAKESAENRLKELDNERREIKASIKSLDSAIRALDGSKSKLRRTQSTNTGDSVEKLDN